MIFIIFSLCGGGLSAVRLSILYMYLFVIVVSQTRPLRDAHGDDPPELALEKSRDH